MKATGRSGSYIDRILDSPALGAEQGAQAGRDHQRARRSRPCRATDTSAGCSGKEEIAAMWAAADEPHLRMFLRDPAEHRRQAERDPGADPVPDRLRAPAGEPAAAGPRRDQEAQPGPADHRRAAAVAAGRDRRLSGVLARQAAGLHQERLAARQGEGRAARRTSRPTRVRHALATELRARGVPEWECAGWLGHSTPYRTTEIYARFRPDYLSQARAAIDAWVKEIGALLAAGPRSCRNPSACQLRARA